MKDKQGRQAGLATIKKLAEERGYEVVDERKTIDGERIRISIIKRKILFLNKNKAKKETAPVTVSFL